MPHSLPRAVKNTPANPDNIHRHCMRVATEREEVLTRHSHCCRCAWSKCPVVPCDKCDIRRFRQFGRGFDGNCSISTNGLKFVVRSADGSHEVVIFSGSNSTLFPPERNAKDGGTRTPRHPNPRRAGTRTPLPAGPGRGNKATHHFGVIGLLLGRR
jgi:hypothetical protein